MRGDGNQLDLNNLPEECDERGRQEDKETVEEISSTTSTETTETSSGFMKRKRTGKDESCEKLYECRFCPLKFYKSQALGGHMNRHRQEKKMETLNRARHLVYCNEGLAPQQPLPQIGCSTAHTFAAENFHQIREVGTGNAELHSRPFYSSLSSSVFSHPFRQTHYSPPATCTL